VTAVAWAVYEGLYLLLVPRSAWYGRRLAGRVRAVAARSRRELEQAHLPALLEADQARFREILRLRAEMEEQTPAGNTLQWEILHGLADLQERFLAFARKRAEYRRLLAQLAEREGVAPLDRAGRPLPPRGRLRALAGADVETLRGWLAEAYDRRLTATDAELARESDAGSRAVLERNREVLSELRANAEEVGRTARNVERQLNLVCDSFTLLHGQMRARPPEQLVPQVEDVLRSSRALADALAELAPLEQQLLRLRS
jgi:hypothetical protein